MPLRKPSPRAGLAGGGFANRSPWYHGRTMRPLLPRPIGTAALLIVVGGLSLVVGCSGDETEGGVTPVGPTATGGSSTGGTTASGGPGGSGQGGTSSQGGAGTLSEQYPNDEWDLSDPAILFASDFEDGLAGWDIASYTGDTAEAIADPAAANEGNGAMKLSFTLTGLESRGDASVSARAFFTNQTGTYYVRFYQRYQDGTARPHHANGTRVFAPGEDVGGTAGIRPEGDSRFNTTIDIDGQGRHFFYTYWHEMRSGRCNDGTAVPGCEGDQGTTYYYGNGFKPANQTVIDRYQWHCYEYVMKSNTPNEYDGEQGFWIDDELVGIFRTGEPLGEWLRDKFYTMGEWGTTPDTPFEGYNWRTSSTVDQVRVSLAIYQEWGTLSNHRDDTPNKAEEQAVYYDDVVIATERIGCRVAR